MEEFLRARITIRGAVQGVGFRPHLYRLATELGLTGWVLNSAQGVFIEVEGLKPQLDGFLLRIEKEKPPRAVIQSLEFSFLDPVGFDRFEIRHSDEAGETTVLVLPDIAICEECRIEIFDPANRRYRYPFTNCTNCGPRYTIIESLPYDRVHTSMRRFEMCGACRREYEDPLNRRFHAQPNACPDCGPQLELWDGAGRRLLARHWALLEAAWAIRAGQIVAVKGLGGFHLVADARNEDAVLRLRRRKHREEKPFALMYPSLEAVKADCRVSELEKRLLLSPESPIVLLRRRSEISNLRSQIAPSIAPRNPYLGVLLPYTPLHHLLMAELGFPIVATSGNLSDEPICTDERVALDRLHGIADLFLVHDRPIVRHVDDSIVRILLGRELVLRRARGYAPLPIPLKEPAQSLLAVGGHLKNTVALTAGGNVFVSPHIGDLETRPAFEAFEQAVQSLQTLYKAQPERIVCDHHPDYLSTRYAKRSGAEVTEIQHHAAHVAACMADNELEGPVLGVAWDGTGYGLDGTVWGGEFFRTDATEFHRIASFRTFRLPGGAAAVKEPRRTAIGLLYELWGETLFRREALAPVRSLTGLERMLLKQMLAKDLNCPRTSSAGRLFDAVASLVGLRQRIGFEGQAAMELEFAMEDVQTEESYPFQISNLKFQMDERLIIDWERMIVEILDDLKRGRPVGLIAVRFHNTLVEAIVEVARRVGEDRVVLTGGCFQNRYLTERAVLRLRAEGFQPYWHQRVPPNDGGIALGQAFAAVRAAQGRRMRNVLAQAGT